MLAPFNYLCEIFPFTINPIAPFDNGIRDGSQPVPFPGETHVVGDCPEHKSLVLVVSRSTFIPARPKENAVDVLVFPVQPGSALVLDERVQNFANLGKLPAPV